MNIMLDKTRSLGIAAMEPAPFSIQMADQRRVQPIKIIWNIGVKVQDIVFPTVFTVIQMEDAPGAYPLLLRRPLLHQGRIKQNWATDQLVVRVGKKKKRIQLKKAQGIRKSLKPTIAEGYKCAEGMIKEEHDEIMRNNLDLIPLFEVDVEGI